MADVEKGDDRSPDRASQPAIDQKRRSSCLFGFCRLVNFMTAICALLCAVAHGMALMVGEGSVQASLLGLQLARCTFTYALACVCTWYQDTYQ